MKLNHVSQLVFAHKYTQGKNDTALSFQNIILRSTSRTELPATYLGHSQEDTAK